MNQLKIGVFGSVIGIIASIAGILWAWALNEAIRFGDFFNLSLYTFFVPEPTLTLVEKNLIIFWRFNEFILSVKILEIIGEWHFTLIATTLILVGIGIYGLYKLEPSSVSCRVSVVLGFVGAILILLIMFVGLTYLTQGTVTGGLGTYYTVAEYGSPISFYLNMSVSSLFFVPSIILTLVLIVFGLSFNSARWVTTDPEKAQIITILFIVGGILILISGFLFIIPYVYIVPSIILLSAYALLAYLFNIIEY